MRFFSLLALTVALTTHATASDLLLYLDFEQTPTQHPYYLAADPWPIPSFDPLELDALERSLRGGEADPDEPGFAFDPLELDALARSLQFTPLELHGLDTFFDPPLIASIEPPSVAFTGRALDRSGNSRDALATGNVILLPHRRSKVAYFASSGRLEFFGSTWWDDSAPKHAMSVLAWVNVHQLSSVDLREIRLGPDGQELVGDIAGVTFEAPVSLFPYVTMDGVLHWSLHVEDANPIFTLEEPVTVGEWFHVAGTYDAVEGTSRLYLNGEEVAMGHGDSELGVYAGSTGSVTINPPRHDSAWSLDDLNIWGRALDGDEVRSVMLSGPTLDNVTAVDEGDAVTTWGALKGR